MFYLLYANYWNASYCLSLYSWRWQNKDSFLLWNNHTKIIFKSCKKVLRRGLFLRSYKSNTLSKKEKNNGSKLTFTSDMNNRTFLLGNWVWYFMLIKPLLIIWYSPSSNSPSSHNPFQSISFYIASVKSCCSA